MSPQMVQHVGSSAQHAGIFGYHVSRALSRYLGQLILVLLEILDRYVTERLYAGQALL